jgi:hypothetical protein
MTKQMTRSQLREAIAEKQGWTNLFPNWKEKGGYPNWMSPEGHMTAAREIKLPDYLGSMDAAMPLLRELPKVELTIFTTWQKVSFCSVRWGTGKKYPFGRVDADFGKEAEAIACAWWQHTTGEVVELVEE